MRHGQDRPLKASVVRPGPKLFVVCEGLLSLYASSGSADVKYYKSGSACGNEREQCRMNQL